MVYNGKPNFLMDDLGGKPYFWFNTQLFTPNKGNEKAFSLYFEDEMLPTKAMSSFLFKTRWMISFPGSEKNNPVFQHLFWHRSTGWGFPFPMIQVIQKSWLSSRNFNGRGFFLPGKKKVPFNSADFSRNCRVCWVSDTSKTFLEPQTTI